MIDPKYCYTWNWDKGPMTYKDFIDCLRKDLNTPDFMIFDYPTPDNEDDYQEALNFFKHLNLKKHFNNNTQ